MMLSNITSLVLRQTSTRSSLCLARTVGRSMSSVHSSVLTANHGSMTRLGLHPPRTSCWFSSSSSSSDTGSHDDFAPKKKAGVADGGQDEALAMIQQHVTNNPVMLYMKGNPTQPMCGFSATVVNILKKEGVDFSSVNVLDYPAIREGVKKYSDWPTIPQLYVNGEFIGGCDIVTSMHESGELKELLETKKQ